ncbi:MAG: VapE domain-containing protein [Microcoleaceae cyanobacterium]
MSQTLDFDIRDHLEKLVKAKEASKYFCPVCSGHNLSINLKTGKYNCFNCGDTKGIARILTEPDREYQQWIDRINQGHITAEQLERLEAIQNGLEEAYQEQEKHNQITELPKVLKQFLLLRRTVKNRIRFNQMTQEIEIDGRPTDLEYPQLEIAMNFGLEIKTGTRQLEGMISKIALENAYNPIRNYLEQCHERFQKSARSVSFLDDLSKRYFGTTDPIHDIYLKKTLIAAIARIVFPGCKHDSTLILQSEQQGIGKSTFFKVLFGEENFCDDMGDFNQKDQLLKVHTSWCLEWAELETVVGRKMNGAVKAFLSCTEDRVRPPYARKLKRMPRKSIIVGTSNQQDLLTDPTGSRRFWIIPVKQVVPIEQLRRERDLIWGAAMELFHQCYPWHLTLEEQKMSNQANEEFYSFSVLDDRIEEFIADKSEATTQELLDALQVDLNNPREIRSAEQQVRRTMSRLKWRSCRLVRDGRRPRGYRRDPESEPQPEQKPLPPPATPPETSDSQDPPPETDPPTEENQLIAECQALVHRFNIPEQQFQDFLSHHFSKKYISTLTVPELRQLKFALERYQSSS